MQLHHWSWIVHVSCRHSDSTNSCLGKNIAKPYFVPLAFTWGPRQWWLKFCWRLLGLGASVLRTALCWATAKWDSEKRNKRFHPDSDGMACGLSVHTHSSVPAGLDKGLYLFIFRLLTNLHMYNFSAVFNMGSLLLLRVPLFKVKLSLVPGLYNTKDKGFMDVYLITGLLERYLLCFLMEFSVPVGSEWEHRSFGAEIEEGF